MKKFLTIISTLLFLFACSNQSSSAEVANKIETSYCSNEELSARKSATPLLENISSWLFQYPSGTTEGGMLSSPVTQDFKSKYFSIYENESGTKYMRFSLDASDKGKSKNGSSVRAELRNLQEWTLSDSASLSYTFYLTSTDFKKAKFTVGQFLQHCTKKDSPLCRIELENGKITAKVTNYKSDGVTKADGKTHSYDLGTISQFQEVSIKIQVENKVLSLYRDDTLKATHTFADSVSSKLKNYFKAGIYYQNKDSPKIFSEIFMRDLNVESK
ncbi:MAG: polysaccharide lyase family 7 protein [Treponema sp.]|nr:polysaccharide lyase family 7 protein [Treponema sp.]